MPPNNSPDADRSPPKLSLSEGPFTGTAAALGSRPGSGWLQELPLQGVTILAVEDSRFACEALRLIARRAVAPGRNHGGGARSSARLSPRCGAD